MADKEKPLEENVYDAPPTLTPYTPAIVNDDAARESEEATPSEAKEEQPTEEVAPEPTPEFDERHKEPLTGLLFIGALQKEFPWLGHRFRIRTLNNRELSEVAITAAPFKGTDYETKAWQVATVAAALVSVDNKPLPTMPVDNNVSATTDRFNYIMDRWFSTTINAVFTEYYKLELQVQEVLEAMGKATG